MKCSKLRLLSFLGMIILTPFFPSFIVKASASTQDEPIIKILRNINAFISGEGGEDSQDGRDSNYKLPSFPRQKKYANGDRYKGGWKNKAPDGVGEMTYYNGDYYIGEWKKGCKEGTGRITYINGDVYEGEWKNNMKQGVGQMIYGNGDSYEGGWVNDQRSGKGVMKYASRDIYDGEWKENMRSGKGVMSYYRGNNYNGLWINDKPSGYGVLKYQNGDSVSGNWINGILEEGEYVIKNKYTFKGRFNQMMINVSSDLGHGFMKGRLTKDEHNYLDGEWHQFNMQSGKVCINNNGLIVQGDLSDGVFDGAISITTSSGNMSFNGTYVLFYKLAKGQFKVGKYEFTGTMKHWCPVEGCLSSPKVDINNKNAVIYCTSDNHTFSISNTKNKTAEEIFGLIENMISQNSDYYDKYFKDRYYINDRQYDGPIRTIEALYFSREGKVVRIWNNYINTDGIIGSSSSKKKKGTRICPVCNGEGTVENFNMGERSVNICYVCNGRGVIDEHNEFGNALADFKQDAFEWALYDSMKVKDKNGEWVYAKDLKGEDVFEYKLYRNSVSFNGADYVIKNNNISQTKNNRIYESHNLSEDNLHIFQEVIGHEPRGIDGDEIVRLLSKNELFNRLMIFPQRESNITQANEINQPAKQETAKDESSVDQFSINYAPDFIQDVDDFKKWFTANLRYPKELVENGVQGVIIAEFTVLNNGTIADVKIKRGIDPLIDNEVVKLIKLSPKWINIDHKSVTYEFPISIKLK